MGRKREEDGQAKAWVGAERPGNARKGRVVLGVRCDARGARDGWSVVGMGGIQSGDAFIAARE